MDNKTFRTQFKKRLYKFRLELLNEIEKLPKDNVSKRIGTNISEAEQVS